MPMERVKRLLTQFSFVRNYCKTIASRQIFLLSFSHVALLVGSNANSVLFCMRNKEIITAQ